MTDRPTRATVAGRAYLDLQSLARRTNRPTDELHQIYALEGFLARLVESSYADRLVLKGGVPEDRPPEADVDRIGLGSDGELYLLREGAVGHGSVFAGYRRDRLRQLDMPLLKSEDAARQPHGELAIGERHQRPVQPGNLRHPQPTAASTRTERGN